MQRLFALTNIIVHSITYEKTQARYIKNRY